MSSQPLEVNWFIPFWDHTSLMISYRQYYGKNVILFYNFWNKFREFPFHGLHPIYGFTYRMICETRKWHKIGKAIPIKRHGRDWRINSIQQVTVRGNIVKHQKISITKIIGFKLRLRTINLKFKKNASGTTLKSKKVGTHF